MSKLPPNNNPGLIVDDFILYATTHLSTVAGLANVISLYPPLGTPGPGIVQWQGYLVDPATPSAPIPAVQLPAVDEVNTEPIEMTDSQLLASEEASLNGSNINEATAVAFESDNSFEEPSPQQMEESERRLEDNAKSEPDPDLPETEKPKDDIKPIPNYKSKLKVPNELILAMRKYGIARSSLERAHFLAQTNHESGNFVYKEELASGTAYEGRKDLGNTESGDGVRYKGRGYIQLTGRANYKRFGPIAGADFVGNPKSVATQYFADTACMFWKSNKLGAKCVDSSTTTIKVITKRINGGYNGLADRISKFSKYWEELQKDPSLWS